MEKDVKINGFINTTTKIKDGEAGCFECWVEEKAQTILKNIDPDQEDRELARIMVIDAIYRDEAERERRMKGKND